MTSQRAVAEVVRLFDFEHVATLESGRKLVFKEGVRERTKGRSLVYLIVNPDGTSWKVGQTGQLRNGARSKNPGWPRLASYRKNLAGNCGNRSHEIEKGRRIVREVHEGARMYVRLTENPIDDEHLITEWLGPSETNRQRTGTL